MNDSSEQHSRKLVKQLASLWRESRSSDEKPDVFAFLKRHPQAQAGDRLNVLLYDQDEDDPNESVADIQLMQPGFLATVTIKLLIRAEGIAALAKPDSRFIEDGDAIQVKKDAHQL